ncbi:MAG: helicase associated domain-containing protein, partial [Parcubacteria group bacterium]|nr:helicase associated domain-containing protein [Parcubacteria group bacterium]
MKQLRQSPVLLQWVPTASPEHRWQLRIIRDFDDPQQLVRANKAWEDLSACTELLECHVPDPKKSETWPVVLALTHQAIWRYRRTGSLSALRILFSRYVATPRSLDKVVQGWWHQPPHVRWVGMSWDCWFALLVEFRKENTLTWPWLRCVYRNYKIGAWCANQRSRKLSHQLSSERIAQLNAIGFQWSMREEQWDAMYALLCAFRKEHPDRWP